MPSLLVLFQHRTREVAPAPGFGPRPRRAKCRKGTCTHKKTINGGRDRGTSPGGTLLGATLLWLSSPGCLRLFLKAAPWHEIERQSHKTRKAKERGTQTPPPRSLTGDTSSRQIGSSRVRTPATELPGKVPTPKALQVSCLPARWACHPLMDVQKKCGGLPEATGGRSCMHCTWQAGPGLPTHSREANPQSLRATTPRTQSLSKPMQEHRA